MQEIRPFLAILIGILVLCLFGWALAQARDLGQWEGADPAIREWYKSVRQPDNPTISCCGEADAYWADATETGPNGELIAVITDDRPDEPLKRRHVPVGTRIVVPPHKITWRHGNPTGHTIIFLNTANDVYCFVQNGGV